MIKKKKHAAGGGGGTGGAPRDSLSHGGGPPSYPGPTAQSSPYRTRPYPVDSNRQGGPPAASSWTGTLSPAFDDLEDVLLNADAHGFEPPASNAEAKRREMGWSTSFPAEYHHAHQPRDYQQTLAYQEQLNQRKRSDQQLTSAVIAGTVSAYPAKVTSMMQATASSPTRQELELLKEVTMREGILERLKYLTNAAAAGGFQADTGSELLQLLLQLRDASVAVVSAMARWHQSLAARTSRPPAFIYQNHNYCAKMVADLNFLAAFSALSRVLGVDSARMKQNPFMMPSPIPDRDFGEIQSLSASTPPRFAFVDPVERVVEAEKYLVWSLVNLPEGLIGHPNASTNNNSNNANEAPPPPAPPLSSQGKRELLTWQQRAEKQLRMLSMPLESPTGQAHVMDSSRMMKRKGYLPSLPLSPAKTLTQLMDNVHRGGYTSPTKSSHCFSSLEVAHDGISYRMTALDVEVLGSNEAPPHAIVTLVAASVLILLSPSDRIPKDLSWPSCQKMLSNGLRLVQRVESVDVDAIPAFKWKALLPFLHNEHYDPMFLMEYSCAAATLCAWVLGVLARAQQNDRAAARTDDDRSELLQELDQEEGELPPRDMPRPLSRGASSRGSGKRVTIGNAEVLFINENEPVSPPSTAASAPGYNSRPASSSSPSVAATAVPVRRSVLLRTSPWTHRGVTYFVSFFLEKSDAAPRELLSVKMYEPMSSVESQMFVSPDDLQLDFGAAAAEYFQRREFGLLCDLILTRLDGIMAPPSRGGPTTTTTTSSSSSSDAWRRPSQCVDPNDQTSLDVEAAAARLQGLADRANADEDAVVRIQCAARQRHARKKVEHVRFAKQQAQLDVQQWSAAKIQSLARQRQAKKRVAHLKLLQRTPTGLPLHGPEEESEDEEEGEAKRAPPPRPETSLSYASEGFEDDFEAE